MQSTYGKRLLRLLLFTLGGLVATALLTGVITYGGVSTRALRIATVAQDMLVFILPAIAVAVTVTKRPDRLLCVDRPMEPRMLLLAVLALICSIPAMNALVAWNEGISLPPAIDNPMRMAEENARAAIKMLMGTGTVMDLVMSLLIVAVLAGFSEEIFFRGALQRLIGSGRVGRHAAIWITAILFSLFHFQILGFIPRVLLGAFFGYLLAWSGTIWLPATIHALNNALVVITEWHVQNHPDSPAGELDDWGVGSPVWILASIAATALIITRLARKP